jgi:hypothetical protein
MTSHSFGILSQENILGNTFWLVNDGASPVDTALLRRSLLEAAQEIVRNSGALIPYGRGGKKPPAAAHLLQLEGRVTSLEAAWRAQQPVGSSIFIDQMAKIKDNLGDLKQMEEIQDATLRQIQEQFSLVKGHFDQARITDSGAQQEKMIS